MIIGSIILLISITVGSQTAVFVWRFGVSSSSLASLSRNEGALRELRDGGGEPYGFRFSAKAPDDQMCSL